MTAMACFLLAGHRVCFVTSALHAGGAPARAASIAFGSGAGAGSAYTDCQKEVLPLPSGSISRYMMYQYVYEDSSESLWHQCGGVPLDSLTMHASSSCLLNVWVCKLCVPCNAH